MRKWYCLGLICLLFACGEKPTDLTGNTPIKINDFNKVFKEANLPITINDSSFKHADDSLVIERKALAQFLPDSVIDLIIDYKNKKNAPTIHPYLRIEKETEYYLLLNVKYAKKREIVTLVFNKKNKYLDAKSIIEFAEDKKNSSKYGKSLNINREPSFTVEENVVLSQGNTSNEKKAWAFTDSSFRIIYFDSDKKPDNKVIINPIDTTLPSKNMYSGDYGSDAKNFISLRDNGAPNKYQFFVHFEKNEGKCIGELKGVLNFTNNKATYNEKGDACIVHFSINGNNISMKEEGNCGNHRGMTCYFKDNFDKIRKAKRKK